MGEIDKPAQLTYYIAYNDDKVFFHYGETGTMNVTTTALTNMETFIVEADYLARCDVLGIVIEEV